MMRWYGYDEMIVGDIVDFYGNSIYVSRLYLLYGFLIEMMKSYIGSMPTSHMKKGWICKTSYDV